MSVRLNMKSVVISFKFVDKEANKRNDSKVKFDK